MNIINAYRETLCHLGDRVKNLVVLNSDVTKSTGTDLFAEKYKNRFVNVGIAEQNQVGIAAGLALAGYVPVVNAFAVFITMRACEQIRTSICYPNLNVKIIGSKGGLSDGYNGPTHHSLEDLSITRAIPNLMVMNPCDDYETRQAITEAVYYKGPVYVRLNSVDIPSFTHGKLFEIGKINVLRSANSDIVLIGTGDTTYQCLQAAEILCKEGIKLKIIGVPTLKPIREEQIIDECINAKYIITVETNVINGGLGGLISEIITTHKLGCQLIKLGINDKYSRSGNYYDLLDLYGLSSNKVIEVVKGLYNMEYGNIVSR